MRRLVRNFLTACIWCGDVPDHLCFIIVRYMDDFLDEIVVDEIAGDRVLLRSLTEDDADSLYKVIDESREFLGKHLPWPKDCEGPEDVASRLDSWDLQAQMGNGACWGIFDRMGDPTKNICPNSLAGCIIVGWVQWAHRSASISYWIGEPFTGRGLATEALQLLCRKMFDLGINRLELSTSVTNPKSAAVARRAGFSEEGLCRQYERINGVFEDHLRFSRLFSDI